MTSDHHLPTLAPAPSYTLTSVCVPCTSAVMSRIAWRPPPNVPGVTGNLTKHVLEQVHREHQVACGLADLQSHTPAVLTFKSLPKEMPSTWKRTIASLVKVSAVRPPLPERPMGKPRVRAHLSESESRDLRSCLWIAKWLSTHGADALPCIP